METYKFGENTLVRSVGFNPYKIESILKNGILSKNEAEKKGIALTRNYEGFNSDDDISMIRPMYSNKEDPYSCLYTMVPKNVNIIVENQEFKFDYGNNFFNHADEVLVPNSISTDKFVGIMIPEKYMNYELRDLPMYQLKARNFSNIRGTSSQLIHYLSSIGQEVDIDEYKSLLNELLLTGSELNKDMENKELQDDFWDIKYALNEFLAENVQEAFDRILNKENCTLEDMITYLNDKTLGLPIYTTSKSLTK